MCHIKQQSIVWRIQLDVSWCFIWVVLPAHTASGSQTPQVDPARMSHPARGWRAWQSGELWWSRRKQRRQLPGTSAPGRTHSVPPYPEAHDTPGPQWGAAASREARWSLPEWMIKEWNSWDTIYSDYQYVNLRDWGLTGMGILESSLPMQFFIMLHKLRE